MCQSTVDGDYVSIGSILWSMPHCHLCASSISTSGNTQTQFSSIFGAKCPKQSNKKFQIANVQYVEITSLVRLFVFVFVLLSFFWAIR